MLANLLPAALPPGTPWITHLLPLGDRADAPGWLERPVPALRQRSVLCGWCAWPAPQQEEVAALIGMPADHVIASGTALPDERTLRVVDAAATGACRACARRCAARRAGPHRRAGWARWQCSRGLAPDAITPRVSSSCRSRRDCLRLPSQGSRRACGRRWAGLPRGLRSKRLSRSGRDLQPLGLRRALESMTGYEALPGVALQYSPHQRAGLALASQWSTSP